MDNFALTLKKYKDELKITQLEMCTILFGVPHRTLQSWLQGEKLPPDYVKQLILNRLKHMNNDDLSDNS
jgi:DNA-binding transcriptional regulator YiaG